MPTALLTGSFEQPDPGRQAVLAALRGALGDWETVIPAGDEARIRGGGPQGGARRRGRARAALASTRKALRADATVLTGAVFELPADAARTPRSASMSSALTVATQTLRRPSALLGVSVAPIRSLGSRAATRLIARRCGLLVLRDSESAEALVAAGVPAPFRIGADPAWAALSDRPEPRADARDRVVVVLCSEAIGLERHLAEALAPLAGAGLEIELLPWREGLPGCGGEGLVPAIARALDGAATVLDAAVDLAGVRDALSGARLALGFRHHALVAAAAAGVPFVALGHEPGLRDLARGLEQRAVPVGAPPTELSAVLSSSLDRAAPTLDAVQARTSSAEEGLRLLRLLLSQGGSEDVRDLDGLPLEPTPGR
jgi:polysaccharide pyruvyl transferase WcaK-like protein